MKTVDGRPKFAALCRLVVLAATLSIVHAQAAAQQGKRQAGEPVGRPAEATVVSGRDPMKLPERVREMREAILAAARTGSLAALRTPLEWNELKPEVGDSQASDPIVHWRAISGDGAGREVLAALIETLEAPFAVVPVPGGGARYVWPAFAEVPLGTLSPGDEVALYRLVTPAEAKVMRDKARWTSWRLVIGADGTWHSFLKGE